MRMRVWCQFAVVVVVKLSQRWDEEAGVAHPRTRWQLRYSNRPAEERHCCYWEVNLIYYCSCFQRNHIYYPHCGVVNFVSLYWMNQTLGLGFRPKENTNFTCLVTSLPPTRRQWFQVYKSQILQEISDYFLKHVRQTAEHVFRVMRQKKWQICGASRLHNLCHSGIAQFSNRSCGDWSDSTA